MMRRREFIAGLGGAAGSLFLPLAVRAQQGRLSLVGVLRPNPKDVAEFFAEPFRRYMKAIGWDEGRNIRFLFAWAEGRNERMPTLAVDLVTQKVDLIITFGDPAIRAAQRATQDHPDRRHDRRHDRQRARGQLGATWRQYDWGEHSRFGAGRETA
jgi:hypothetical protein